MHCFPLCYQKTCFKTIQQHIMKNSKFHNNIYKSIIQPIPDDWMPPLKYKTSQESLLKVFCYNNRGIRDVKNLQKLSNKGIYFTLQNNNENYKKPFKSIT